MSLGEIIILVVLIGILFLLIINFLQNHKVNSINNFDDKFENISKELNDGFRNNRLEIGETMHMAIKNLGSLLNESQDKHSVNQMEKLTLLSDNMLEKQDDLKTIVSTALNNNSQQTEQKLENIRKTVSDSLFKLQEENSRKLDEMRNVVDEKLQKTLEDRISKSFSIVSERLEQVYKGLGEMQNLAVGVGDLKKVLSNVKTRGILGEIQLGSILEQILTKDQYEVNFITKRGSTDRVEYAIKFPGDEESPIYLPIDAKFPVEDYERLLEAYETANPAEVSKALKSLTNTIKEFAKTIRDKYIDVPNTTDFGIMFLPVEGLYSEVVRAGLVETLQREYKINIAGPTTMAALLNSLQMGFRTLAIQKHSTEVWRVLGAVKTEFDKFGEVLSKTQTRLVQANEELEELIGKRTKKIIGKLRNVTSLNQLETSKVLSDDDNE